MGGRGKLICETCAVADGKREWHRMYVCSSPAGLNMFRNLCSQVASGCRYRSPSGAASGRLGGVYLLAIGNQCGLTVDEGGFAPTESTILEVGRWRAEVDAGEPIKDGDLARAYFSADALACVSSYIAIAVLYFDDLCVLADRGADGLQPWRSKRPENTRRGG
jgi:hypothetical protein